MPPVSATSIVTLPLVGTSVGKPRPTICVFGHRTWIVRGTL